MSNKQPFYHYVTFTFTTTRPLTEKEVLKELQELEFSRTQTINVQVEEFHEPEPGDPADLM